MSGRERDLGLGFKCFLEYEVEGGVGWGWECCYLGI